MSHAEAPISVTFKSAMSTLITIRANTAEEFADLVATNRTVLFDAVMEAEETIKETVGAQTPTKQQAINTITKSLGATVVSESAAIANPDSPDRFCVHGRMNRLEGEGQYGFYKGFFCPSPKGTPGKCATQYVKKQEPEYASFVADPKRR